MQSMPEMVMIMTDTDSKWSFPRVEVDSEVEGLEDVDHRLGGATTG